MRVSVRYYTISSGITVREYDDLAQHAKALLFTQEQKYLFVLINIIQIMFIHINIYNILKMSKFADHNVNKTTIISVVEKYSGLNTNVCGNGRPTTSKRELECVVSSLSFVNGSSERQQRTDGSSVRAAAGSQPASEQHSVNGSNEPAAARQRLQRTSSSESTAPASEQQHAKTRL